MYGITISKQSYDYLQDELSDYILDETGERIITESISDDEYNTVQQDGGVYEIAEV